MNPKVSIIVPIYKVEPYIHKCIKSLLGQTFSDFELILVDDGSPDSCGIICDEYSRKDNRVRVIHKVNGGLSSARNVGIEIARGEYIAFIDGDDYVHPEMFDTLYNIAIDNSSDITVCDFVKVHENENVSLLGSYDKELSLQHFDNIEALNQLYSTNWGEYMTGAGNNVKWVVAWNKLYKKEIFHDITYKHGRIFEDEYIIHQLLYRSKRVTYIPYQFHYYVQRSTSIVHSSYSLKNLDKVYALQERVDFFRKKHLDDLFNKALVSYIETFFWNYYKAKVELDGIELTLRNIKKEFDGHLKYVLSSKQIGWKQKSALLLFCIHPYLYELIRKVDKYKKKRSEFT